ATQRVARCRVRVLLICGAAPGRGARNTDGGEYLTLRECGGEEPHEEVVRGDLPLAARAAHGYGGSEGEDGGRHIGAGVGVREAPADRAHVPDLQITHLRRRLRQQRRSPPYRFGLEDLPVGRQRAD